MSAKGDTMSGNIIDTLLASKAEELEAAKKTREAKKKETIEILFASLKEYLGDFYLFLEERYQKTGEKYILDYETGNDGIPTKIFYHLPAMSEEGLAPIDIKWSEKSLREGFYDRGEIFKVGGHSFGDLASALMEARKTYPAYMENLKAEKLKEFRNSIPSYWGGVGIDEAKIDSDLEILLAEFPDLGDEARSHVKNWKIARRAHLEKEEANRREREQEQATQALENTIRIGYLTELSEWMKETERIQEENRAAAARIQEENDRDPYTVYKLTYAILATYNEDGEQYKEVETRSVYTLYAIPDSFGFWDINGKKTKYFEPVKLEREEVKASSGILAERLELPGTGIEIFFAPGSSEESIDRVHEEISPLPDGPKLPEELSGYYSGDLRREARSLLNGEDDRSEAF
jgi:hypothetical protein